MSGISQWWAHIPTDVKMVLFLLFVLAMTLIWGSWPRR